MPHATCRKVAACIIMQRIRGLTSERHDPIQILSVKDTSAPKRCRMRHCQKDAACDMPKSCRMHHYAKDKGTDIRETRSNTDFISERHICTEKLPHATCRKVAACDTAEKLPHATH